MKFKQIIGIDVSKLTLYVYLYKGAKASSFKNTDAGIMKLLKWMAKNNPCESSQSLLVIEHTGLYSYKLALLLSREGIAFTMVSGLALKRSMGIVRGKSDPMDAKAIAQYGYRLREELQPTVLADSTLMELKQLLTLRKKMVKDRTGYKCTLKEQQQILGLKDDHILISAQRALIEELSKRIRAVEKQCKALIKSVPALEQLFKWITSIKGIGPHTGWHLIAVTEGFKKFHRWRDFASYAGTAPFPYQSGTSIKGRTKVSHLANKNMKKLLTMCALSAIRHDREIKEYYQRKLEEKKHKMVIINAVRNKLIARVFAVVKRQSPFVDTCKFAA